MKKESVLTLEEKEELIVVVRRDKNGRQVLYKTIPMVEDEIKDLFDYGIFSASNKRGDAIVGVGLQPEKASGLLKKEPGNEVTDRATTAGK